MYSLGRLVICILVIRVTKQEGSPIDKHKDIVSDESTKSRTDKAVRVAGLFNIYNDKKCTEIRMESIQAAESVYWIFDQLNKYNYIPGIDLALDVYETCRAVQKTSLQTIRVANGVTQKNSRWMGVIGPRSSAEAMISSEILSSIEDQYRVPQVVYSVTSTLLEDKTTYKNLIRVIPPDDIQVKTILALLKKLEWNYIAVIRENRTYALEATNLLLKLAASEHICIPKVFDIKISEKTNTYIDIINNITIGGNTIKGVIFFGSNENARLYLEALKYVNLSELPKVIFSEAASSMNIKQNEHKANLTNLAFFLSPPRRNISEFDVHWKNIFSNMSYLKERAISNPYLIDAMQTLQYDNGNSDCQRNVTACHPLEAEQIDRMAPQSMFVQYSIKASLVMANAIRILHQRECGSNYSGPCAQFINSSRSNLLDILRQTTVKFTEFPIHMSSFVKDGLTIKFDRSGEINVLSPEVPLYEVYDHTGCSNGKEPCNLKKVAEYRSSNLSTTTAYQNYAEGFAQCLYTCSECIPKDLPSKILYKPGDIIVGGMMPIHHRDSNTPFKCGSIRGKIGLDLAMAIDYAVEMVNNDTNIFPNKTVGYLIMDTCNDGLVTQQRILDFVASQSVDGVQIDTGKVVGVVGPMGSTATMSASSILSDLRYVQVGCCSTAALLSNRNLYPTFLRVSMSINKQVEVMVQLAKEMNSNYLQVVYSEGEFGESGKNALINEAYSQGLCVVNDTIRYRQGDNAYDIIRRLRHNPGARLVILFLRSHIAPIVAEALNAQLEDDDGFVFMASDSWGNREDNIYKKRKLRGMITITQEIDYDIGFENYLRQINIRRKTNKNPFLESFNEARSSCYLEKSFNKSGKSPCPGNHHLVEPGSLDPWHPFVISATYALLQGAYNAVKERPTDPNILRDVDTILKHVKKVKIGQRSLFDDNGDGRTGFHIYNVQKNVTNEKMVYVQVGQWKDGHLQFDIDNLDENIKSSRCTDKRGYCKPCFDDTTSDQSSSDIAIRSTLFCVIGVFAGIMATMLAARVYKYIKKKRKAFKKKQSDYRDDNPYYLPTF